MVKSERNQTLDVLKGLAIAAVVLYHSGGGYGYLGVDIFLVISGFFMMSGLLRDIENNSYSYFRTIRKNILRLYPLLLIVTAVSLLVGLFVMLPDDFENLGQSAVASSLFSNNLLSMITTRNYWDVINEYKPLMHTWYLGVLMQIYVIFQLLIAIVWKKLKNSKKFVAYYTAIVFSLSLALYVLPYFSANYKFYFPMFRMYEVLAGALVALAVNKAHFAPNTKFVHIAKAVLTVVLAVLIFANVEIFGDRLLLVVIITSVLVLLSSWSEKKEYAVLKPLALLGKASYSIFLWHQVILALLRYCFAIESDILLLLLLLGIMVILVIPSYIFVENKLILKLKTEKKKWVAISACSCLGIVVIFFGVIINSAGGVVRDVPELGIYTRDKEKTNHASYCDRVYQYNTDFISNKLHVLVVGDSFGRDWANILLESDISDNIEISYIYSSCDSINENIDRFAKADYVFYSTRFLNLELLEMMDETVPIEKLYVVSSKSFGENNGHIYVQRNRDDYFNLTVKMDEEITKENEVLKERYQDHYVDLVAPVLADNGEIRVFSDNNKMISQDCRHLTQYGAQYYARVLDFSFFEGE